MKKTIAIIGGGPSSFSSLTAFFLDIEKFKITIYEKIKQLVVNFLVAGKGGFNVTHSRPMEALLNDILK
jgi:predicted flavoprotein YhiN